MLIEHSLTCLSSGELFSSPPMLRFRTAAEYCHQCNNKLRVLKTQTKTVYSMLTGKFVAHHTLLHCPQCNDNHVYQSDDLHQIVAVGSNYAYNVIVHIGRAMFQQHRNVTEVQEDLNQRGIIISASEVSLLAKKFIIYLSIAHENIKDEIKNYFIGQGGYILHLDGTTQGDSPHLISTIDQLSKFVLGNIKVASEKSDLIEPLLRDLKENYANPLAIVTDMGGAMLLAVKEVFPHVPNFICHFHFLRDIGNDLLKNQYGLLRNALKKHGITTALQYRKRELEKVQFHDYESIIAQITDTSKLSPPLDILTANSICYTIIAWILDGKKQGNGYGFPFDRILLIFYKRIVCAYRNVKLFVQSLDTHQQQKASKNLNKLVLALENITTDSQLAAEMDVFEQHISVFDNLRKALRIALPETKNGLNDQGIDTEIQTIEKDVHEFVRKTISHENYQDKTELQKMVGQIKKYNHKLFADPITVNTQNGSIQIQPQRTNNIMEQFFREFRRKHRRASGDDAINKKLQAMLADTLLIKNLENKEYMKILLQNKTSLEQLFATIEIKQIRQRWNEINQEKKKIPTKIKSTIKQDHFWNVLNLHKSYSN